MTRERSNIHVHALHDGRVLVIGDDTTAELWDPASGEWHATASLNNPRTAFASVVLHDGRVLVTGGLNHMEQSYSSAYLFDPATESWEKTAGLMITARTRPSAAVLPDGRVLVAGGYFHVSPYGQSTGINVLAVSRSSGGPDATAPTGPADIVPGPFGAALATAEIFDPATGEWSSTGSMQYARHGAAAVTLADGRVLVAGALGSDSGVEVAEGAQRTAEIYDPQTGRFALAGTLPEIDWAALEAQGVPQPSFGGSDGAGSNGRLVALPDGGAVLIGRAEWWKHVGEATRSFRFDSEVARWYEIGQPYVVWSDPTGGPVYETADVVPRFGAFVAALGDGRIVIAGGDGAGQTSSITEASAVLYEPGTDGWSPLPPMPEARAGGAAVMLADGSILLVGGHVNEATERGSQGVTLRSAVRLITNPS